MNNSPNSVMNFNNIAISPFQTQASPAMTGSDVSNLTDIWTQDHPFYGVATPQSLGTTDTPSTNKSHVRRLFDDDTVETLRIRELEYENRIDMMSEELNRLKATINESILVKIEDEICNEEKFNKLVGNNERNIRAVKRKATEFLSDAMLSLSRAKTARFLGDSLDSHMDEAFNAVSDGLDYFLDIKKERN